MHRGDGSTARAPTARRALGVEAKLFRGLADGSRLSILEALAGGPRTVSEVVSLTGLSQPNASMHLNCLWCCGLVDREPRGRCTVYRIGNPKVLVVLQAARGLLRDVRDRIESCHRYEERA